VKDKDIEKKFYGLLSIYRNHVRAAVGKMCVQHLLGSALVKIAI